MAIILEIKCFVEELELQISEFRVLLRLQGGEHECSAIRLDK